MRCCCGQKVLSLFDFSSTERTLSVNRKFIFLHIIFHHSFIFGVERHHNELIRLQQHHSIAVIKNHTVFEFTSTACRQRPPKKVKVSVIDQDLLTASLKMSESSDVISATPPQTENDAGGLQTPAGGQAANNSSNSDPLETAKWTRFLPEAFGIQDSVRESSYRWCVREG
jgi:hypothetical protein